MKIFVLTLFGATIHLNLFYVGLDYTPTTVASALSSTIPALTFTMAVLFFILQVSLLQMCCYDPSQHCILRLKSLRRLNQKALMIFLQAKVCDVYSARLSMNTLIYFFVSLQSAAIALIFDRNASSWKLEWNITYNSHILSI
ncbi:WAT1-related protein At2g40900-like [Asparagus officinalis]|uniref:WAT1-related protein At2g40900-like n=1 Tax=Asparagus officinalis TaxID=4686 RepID=UPI00098E80C4|nr:WAT1-related protein At2g40900-like [Asparagus officinalis]